MHHRACGGWLREQDTWMARALRRKRVLRSLRAIAPVCLCHWECGSTGRCRCSSWSASTLSGLHLVQPAAEAEVREVPDADEVELGLERVAVGGPVHEHPEERELLGVEPVLAAEQRPHDLPLAHEDGHGVGLDDAPGELADVVIGPLEDDLALRVVRCGDELAAEECHRNAPDVEGDPRC